MDLLSDNERKILDFLYTWIRPIRAGDLKDRMNFKHSTLGSQLEILEKKGLIEWERYGAIALSDKGKDVTSHLTQHHRLFEVFLVDTLNMKPEEAHAESIRLSSVISCSLMRKIKIKYKNASICPCGQIIPQGYCTTETEVS